MGRAGEDTGPYGDNLLVGDYKMEIRHIYIPSVYTNCYLLLDEDSGALAVIDPGDDVSDTLLRLCTDNGWDVRSVFLTHGHYDHVGGVNALRRAFPQVPVYLHPEDAGKDSSLFPTAGLGQVTLWRDGEVVKLGNLNVEVLHTPGHTKGSVCLKCRDALFTGDTLFAGSCGRTDFPGGDYDEMMASLQRLGKLEGDLRVFPGHNGFTSLQQERETNPYLREAMGE